MSYTAGIFEEGHIFKFTLQVFLALALGQHLRSYIAFGLSDLRRLTAATAAVTHARLFTDMLCYVLKRLHFSCVLSNKLGLHRLELINKTLVNDGFSDFFLKLLFIYSKSHKF